jgi:diguanylate cyclase (GGDEF)-like protein
MTLYDLNSIALTVLVFDLCIALALAVAYFELPARERSVLKIWLLGLGFCIGSTTLSVFNQWVPLQVRGALPHALLCLGLWLYWHAICGFYQKINPPIWLGILIALLCVAVAYSRSQLQASILISSSALFLHIAAGLSSLNLGAQNQAGHRIMGAHWVVATGFVVVALVMAYRIGFWWFSQGNLGPVGLQRASLRILSGITNVVCSAGFILMCMAKLSRELALQADTDALTKVFNRRAVLSRIRSELDTAGTDARASVLMLDVDHFKSINDNHGHDVGDQALIAIANALNSALPANALLGRYGGEEFLLWLPGADDVKARQIAEDLRVRCAALQLRTHNQSLLKISASIGVGALTGKDLGAAIHCADQALLEAKRLGRNQVR